MVAATAALIVFGGAGAVVGGTACDVRIGTLGAGVEVVQSLSEQFNVRIGANHAAFTLDGDLEDVKYKFDIDLNTVSLLFDWHPASGPFRLTAGGFYNGNEARGRATPSDWIDIGNSSYPPEFVGALNAKIDFEPLAGYFGIGFGNAVQGEGHWSALFDLGLMFFAAPEFTLTAEGPLAGYPAFQADLAQERQNIEDDVTSKITFYPVLSLGLAYRF